MMLESLGGQNDGKVRRSHWAVGHAPRFAREAVAILVQT